MTFCESGSQWLITALQVNQSVLVIFGVICRPWERGGVAARGLVCRQCVRVCVCACGFDESTICIVVYTRRADRCH